MSVTSKDTTFDCVEYDGVTDVLYLRMADEPAADDWNIFEEGDALVHQGARLIGIDILNASLRMQQDGDVTVTLEDESVLRSPDVRAAIGSHQAA